MVALSLNLKWYFTYDYFLQIYGGLKISILDKLRQSTHDLFRAINA